MIRWHSLLNSAITTTGSIFPGKHLGPLFVDATLLNTASGVVPETSRKSWAKLARDMWAMLASDSTVQACPGISIICCITAPRRGCRSKLRMFFSVLTCAIHSRTARVKNVAQIWLHRASTPGIADLDSCCKNGIASLSQLYSTLWFTGATNSVSGKDVKKITRRMLQPKSATDNTGRFIIDMTQAMS